MLFSIAFVKDDDTRANVMVVRSCAVGAIGRMRLNMPSLQWTAVVVAYLFCYPGGKPPDFCENRHGLL